MLKRKGTDGKIIQRFLSSQKDHIFTSTENNQLTRKRNASKKQKPNGNERTTNNHFNGINRKM